MENWTASEGAEFSWALSRSSELPSAEGVEAYQRCAMELGGHPGAIATFRYQEKYGLIAHWPAVRPGSPTPDVYLEAYALTSDGQRQLMAVAQSLRLAPRAP